MGDQLQQIRDLLNSQPTLADRHRILMAMDESIERTKRIVMRGYAQYKQWAAMNEQPVLTYIEFENKVSDTYNGYSPDNAWMPIFGVTDFTPPHDQ